MTLRRILFLTMMIGSFLTTAVANSDQVEGEGIQELLSRESNVELDDVQKAWEHADRHAGILNVSYAPDQITKLKLRPQMITTIVFPDWEDIGDVYLGDGVMFEAERTRSNVIVVRGLVAGVDTNLIAMGRISKKPYSFYLRTLPIHSKEIPDTTVFMKALAPLSHLVDKEEGQEGAPVSVSSGLSSSDLTRSQEIAKTVSLKESTTPDEADWLLDIPPKPEDFDFAYTMHGDKSIAPERVFNDGLFTYLDYGEGWHKKDMPIVFLVKDDIDQFVNSRVKGNVLILEQVGDLTLKSGEKITCIKQKRKG